MAAGKKVLVELFIDVISPYSYITYGALTKYQKLWKNMDLKLRPVYLAGIMGTTGNKPPGMLPAKGRYMGKDLKKVSDYFDVPYKMPKNATEVMFVKGTVTAQRLLTAVAQKHPEYLTPLAGELYLRFWWKHLDVTEIPSLREACQVAGISSAITDDLIASIKTTEVKEGLKATTQEAVDYGAFGLPFFVVHLDDGPNVMFGSDRLFLLAHYLNESWPGSLKDLDAKLEAKSKL